MLKCLKYVKVIRVWKGKSKMIGSIAHLRGKMGDTLINFMTGEFMECWSLLQLCASKLAHSISTP